MSESQTAHLQVLRAELVARRHQAARNIHDADDTPALEKLLRLHQAIEALDATTGQIDPYTNVNDTIVTR